jgi:hypothetical protein
MRGCFFSSTALILTIDLSNADTETMEKVKSAPGKMAWFSLRWAVPMSIKKLAGLRSIGGEATLAGGQAYARIRLASLT